MLATDTRPLILTAQLDEQNQEYFDGLRDQYFPPERNYLRAHLTMFHALPGSEIAGLATLLVDVTARQHAMVAEVFGLRSLGNGVAFTLRCPELERIRREIAFAFGETLTAQDRQTWRPHITVQNKVGQESARELLVRLQQTFQPWDVSINGLQLWRYKGGPWEFVDRFQFGIASHPSTAAT